MAKSGVPISRIRPGAMPSAVNASSSSRGLNISNPVSTSSLPISTPVSSLPISSSGASASPSGVSPVLSGDAASNVKIVGFAPSKEEADQLAAWNAQIEKYKATLAEQQNQIKQYQDLQAAKPPEASSRETPVVTSEPIVSPGTAPTTPQQILPDIPTYERPGLGQELLNQGIGLAAGELKAPITAAVIRGLGRVDQAIFPTPFEAVGRPEMTTVMSDATTPVAPTGPAGANTGAVGGAGLSNDVTTGTTGKLPLYDTSPSWEAPVGSGLVSAGANAAMQAGFTGKVDPKPVVTSGVIGGGVAAAGQGLGLSGAGSIAGNAGNVGALGGAVAGQGAGAWYRANNPNERPNSPGEANARVGTGMATAAGIGAVATPYAPPVGAAAAAMLYGLGEMASQIGPDIVNQAIETGGSIGRGVSDAAQAFASPPSIDFSGANPFGGGSGISDAQKAWQNALAVQEAAAAREAANVMTTKLRAEGRIAPDAWISAGDMNSEGWSESNYKLPTPVDPYQISTGTWLCTEIAKLMPVSIEERNGLSKLRRFSIRNHRAESALYFKNGHRLVSAIKDKAAYFSLKKPLIEDCVEEVKAGNMQAAYDKYMETIKGLCHKLQVDLS